MGSIEPACEKALVEVFKVISWLDDKRWKQQIRGPEAFVKGVLEANELQPIQKILIHWLVYITDRGKRADVLWESNTPKIKELIIRYFNKDVSEKEQVSELCKQYERENRIQAFPADLESIQRTLILLLDYEKDIVNFTTRSLSEWRMKYPESFCPRMAFSLYLLSYRDVGSLAKKNEWRKQKRNELNRKMEEAKGILNNDSRFEEEFKAWYGRRRWHKRLWAALRDYKKFGSLPEIFVRAIKDQANKAAWTEDFDRQLELPGDIWNTRFFEKCIKPVAESTGVRGRNAPKVIRHLWGKIKSKCPESYPEQFDISFDFAPRMCNRRLCDVCVFGPKGAELVCIPDKSKYCPVTLISCGYTVKCSESRGKCLIREGFGKNTCKGILN